ncbi:hypothetical protein HD806DRAFT_538707 [Xylariaceae sp. AK1471]|nr:hypothetical protein HD806DRAFT_538707 [Xylariaceae sp. AK1471]
MNPKNEVDNSTPQDVIAEGPSNHDISEQIDPNSVANDSDTDCTDWSDQPDHWSDSSGDDGPQTSIEIGKIITSVFHADSMDIGSEQDTIFNDSITSGDDDESGSEMSSVYEELDFPVDLSQLVERVVYVSDPAVTTDAEMSDDSLTSYVPDSDEEYDSEDKGDDGGAEPSQEDERMDSGPLNTNAVDKATEDPVAGKGSQRDDPVTKESFTTLQQDPYPAKAFLLNQSYEQVQWHILELEEIKRTVERQLVDAAERQESLGKDLDAKHQDFCRKRETLGISEELWGEYLAFCESMEPEFGSTSGWSITCDADHSGSYVKYDPEFTLFKEHSEMPYKQYNFRCEPSIDTYSNWRGTSQLYVVEFWPVAHPGTDIEDASTWGDLYPALYDLAAKAARDGSEAAMDMLIALPDQHASFKGGWLFEYSIADPLKSKDPGILERDYGFKWTQNPVQSRRWTYRSAHKVDAPVDETTKRERLQLGLRPEYIFSFRPPTE